MGEVEFKRFNSQGDEIRETVDALIEMENQQKTPIPGRKSDLGPLTHINSLSPLLRPLKFN
jgi:hypothetical protein